MTNQRIIKDDVARRAGASVATVSLSLHNDPRIRENTKRIVRTVAREMNYRPLASDRVLAGGRTHMIGVVFSTIEFEQKVMFGAYSLALQRVSDLLSQRDYHLSLALRNELVDEKGSRKLARMFDEIGVEGFLLIQAPGADLARVLEAQNVPFVILDGKAAPGELNVIVDECRAAELAVEHLIGLGHRRIANLTTLSSEPNPNSPPAHRRVEFPRGYLRAMAQAGLPAKPGWDRPIGGDISEDLEVLWQQPQPPTALLIYDDTVAGRTIKALSKRGLNVPRDVSVVALHDIGYAGIDWLGSPSITCKKNMQEEMASVAVQKLLQVVEKPDTVQDSVTLKPELVIRESSGPCPGPR